VVKDSQDTKAKANPGVKKVTSSFSLDELGQLIDMLERHQVTEFEIERGEEKLKLKRGPAQQIIHVDSHSDAYRSENRVESSSRGSSSVHFTNSEPRAYENGHAEPVVVAPAKSIYHEIKSPMVGTFYKRPAPDAKAFADVGQVIKKGDVLGIVEAMKLMNEIEADISGKIVEVCLNDAQMVEYGEVLFRVDTSASS